jgi:hypothetical protein
VGPHEPYFPPPDTDIISPQTAFDGLGNMLVVYQVNPGNQCTTYLQKLDPDGNRLWGDKGVSLDGIPPAPETRDYPRCYDDSLDLEHNSLVLWCSGSQAVAGRLDISGNPAWTAGPAVLGTSYGSWYWQVLPSTLGNTVAWLDSEKNLQLQTLDAAGKPLWTEQPTIPHVAGFSIACDRDGFTWVVWNTGYTVRNASEDGWVPPGIYLQVLDTAGRLVWDQAKCLVQPADSTGYLLSCVTAGNAGDVVVALVQNWIEQPVDDCCGPLTLQKIDISGNTLWSVETDYNDVHDHSWKLSNWFVSDDEGGAYFFSSTRDSIAVQHVDAAGKLRWHGAGMTVARRLQTGKAGVVEHIVSGDGSGGAYVIWNSYEAGRCPYYAQHIDAAGNAVWLDTGLEIGQLGGTWGMSIAVENGSVYLGVSGLGVSGSRLQKIAPDGTLPWGPEGLRFDEWFPAEQGAETTTSSVTQPSRGS